MGSHIIQNKLEGMDMKQRECFVDDTKTEVVKLLKHSIRPEFLNRIDELVMFTPLDLDEVKEVVQIQIKALKKRLKQNHLSLELSKEAVDFIARQGYEPQFGARPVKRVIQRLVLNELSKKILGNEIMANSNMWVDVKDKKLVFVNK